MRFAVLLLSAACLFACSRRVTTTGTKNEGKYSEDLSVWREGIVAPSDSAANAESAGNANNAGTKRDASRYVEARHTVNNSIDAVLDSIDRINLSFGLVDGYTIQLYSGVRREEALDVKKQASTLLPTLDAEVQFVQPNFRVRAGKYINRIDAQKDFMAVKRFFPNAIVIPERIPLKSEP